ncbi:MAG: alkyl hydroperoxide reductase/Thiol specific antioxidant/Mal allergen [Frankiales bacterium]|jgi:peroxiredoxin Q/BCP|nr:alkyl hydroperoxide reductase/Thiol specific antioxidant/Mal allergen [Frankiales bacterium]
MLDRPAPDFTLPAWTAEGRTTLTLSAQTSPVVLAFYPGDDTPVCTRQLCSYQDDLGMLSDLGAVLWGISSQDLDSHERFAARRGLTFPLLSDEDKAVHALYGAKGLMGLPKRAVVVVDAAGVVRFHHASQVGLTYQDSATIASVVKGLQPESR